MAKPLVVKALFGTKSGITIKYQCLRLIFRYLDYATEIKKKTVIKT